MFPVGSPSAQYIDAWTKKVSADSNGRLTIRIFPVNTLAYNHALKYFKAEGAEVVRLSPQEGARWMPIIDHARERVGAELDAKGYPGTEIVKYMRERIEHYTH
jgi:hypothetical protein